jgi:hypothetical protein
VTKIGDFIVDFLHEFEAIFKKRLKPVYQGPRGSCLMKKTRGHKSRVRVPYGLAFPSILLLTFGSSCTSKYVVAVFLVPSGFLVNIKNRPESPFFHKTNLNVKSLK